MAQASSLAGCNALSAQPADFKPMRPHVVFSYRRLACRPSLFCKCLTHPASALSSPLCRRRAGSRARGRAQGPCSHCSARLAGADGLGGSCGAVWDSLLSPEARQDSLPALITQGSFSCQVFLLLVGSCWSLIIVAWVHTAEQYHAWPSSAARLPMIFRTPCTPCISCHPRHSFHAAAYALCFLGLLCSRALQCNRPSGHEMQDTAVQWGKRCHLQCKADVQLASSQENQTRVAYGKGAAKARLNTPRCRTSSWELSWGLSMLPG